MKWAVTILSASLLLANKRRLTPQTFRRVIREDICYLSSKNLLNCHVWSGFMHIQLIFGKMNDFEYLICSSTEIHCSLLKIPLCKLKDGFLDILHLSLFSLFTSPFTFKCTFHFLCQKVFSPFTVQHTVLTLQSQREQRKESQFQT